MIILAVTARVLTACQPAAQAQVAIPTQAGARLRITNDGSAPILGLVVLFPDQQIAFGDVQPGETVCKEKLMLLANC